VTRRAARQLKARVAVIAPLRGALAEIDSPFENHAASTYSITAKVGPIPVIYRADFRREQPG
jgi:hypothetical protein